MVANEHASNKLEIIRLLRLSHRVVKDYLLCMFRQARDHTEQIIADYKARLTEFFKIFNGTTSSCTGVLGARLVHYTNAGLTKADLMTQTVAVVIRVVLAHMPVVPVMNKWTKTGPSIDFYWLGQRGGILRRLLAPAWQRTALPCARTPLRRTLMKRTDAC